MYRLFDGFIWLDKIVRLKCFILYVYNKLDHIQEERGWGREKVFNCNMCWLNICLNVSRSKNAFYLNYACLNCFAFCF